ncbi:hypothetical protein BHOIPH791_09090 [Bartonella henselae]|nr:hypothetical protein BH80429_10930 [Bartonella henselae]GFF04386.1 hypothetical protein BH80429_12070 [Bartonella henselae]
MGIALVLNRALRGIPFPTFIRKKLDRAKLNDKSYRYAQEEILKAVKALACWGAL